MVYAKATTALVVLVALLTGGALAQTDVHEALPAFSDQGADTCLRCHSGDTVEGIFSTPHAVASDPGTPFAQQQCESCHGPGGDHAGRLRPGQERPAPLAFAHQGSVNREQEVAICLSCHQSQERNHWQGSVHERQGLTCTSCHSVHTPHDPVMNRQEQASVCFDCHTRERAQSLQASAHPMRQGQMACTECHQPHGTLNDAMLVRGTLNETCLECHAEKRGPFLWEHAPAAEDCASCHVPHGSNHASLLRRRAPLLCQECHSRAGHPSIAQTGERLPEGRPSAALLGGSCTNCHSQVHGSNHPSGRNLSR
ncbi:DmsE family decaheme c-type cytochrome [Marinimicrobium koreense]|uniref:DmsE family decaheme c-type cytochrome n=1 Tax=Marinimicrobium koreense TaxID=306545 RepID=A0A3N1NZA8_9GAMM|nr:DmsE family decaheme c-type cytochrome [Marinimicrobium koreense]ROQ20731.1 DmsE family decaheme c-type cytochrome [Marinimicrobium koreense]